MIVNGRDFSGYVVAGGAPGAQELGASALSPNRSGEDLGNFLTNYLDDGDHSPNESYDAADFQNMFLSGRDIDGNVIPSFHRKSLVDFSGGGLCA